MTVLYNNNELHHHGVKGQKWGVRRYQNTDGTLTPAGEKRYRGTLGEIRRAKDETKLRNEVMTKQDKKDRKKLAVAGALGAIGTYALSNSLAARLAVSGQGTAAAALSIIGTLKAVDMATDAYAGYHNYGRQTYRNQVFPDMKKEKK